MKIVSINRAAGEPLKIDRERRVLGNIVFVTRSLAYDACIVEPRGIDTAHFLSNPIVCARHGFADTLKSPVIGRAVDLALSDNDGVAGAQFADTELGREYAYLYGVNDEGIAYCRAWSVRLDIVRTKTIDWIDAKNIYGSNWDAQMEERLRNAGVTAVQVVQTASLQEFSAVALGADREALTRAYREKGVEIAGTLAAELDVQKAMIDLGELRRAQVLDRQNIEALSAQLQALRRDVTSAAAKSDSEAIARALDELLGKTRKHKLEAIIN